MSAFKSMASLLVSILLLVPSLSMAHSGHGEPGVLHDLSHVIWLLGALLVMIALAVKVFLSKKQASRSLSRNRRHPEA